MNSFLKKYLSCDYNSNVVVIFKPLYVLLSLTGLFPYSIQFPKGKSSIILRHNSVLHSLCGLAVFAFLCYAFVFRISIAINRSDLTQNFIANFNNVIGNVSRLCFDIAVYYCVFRNVKGFVRILEEVAECWSRLSLVDSTPVLQYLHKRLLLPLILWLVVYTVISICICSTGKNRFCIDIFEYGPNIITGLVLAFYGTLMLFVVGLLKNITRHCALVGTHPATSNPRDINDGRLFRQLELSYVKALEIKREIARIFETPLAFMIFLCFHTSLRNLHMAYHGMIISKTFNIPTLLNRFVSTLYSLAKIYVVAFTEIQLKNVVTDIGEILHDVRADRERRRLEVQHFISLISFSKPETRIYDYFVLDASLIFGMIATMVTYIIILVQFDNASSSFAANYTYIGYHKCCL